MAFLSPRSKGRTSVRSAGGEQSLQNEIAGADVCTEPASLLDERFEHDSCGVGFVASALGKPSHDILLKALTALGRLEHRGAVAADGASSDGIGLMAQRWKSVCFRRS